MWNCSLCKHENTDNDDFCVKCGQINKKKEEKYTLVLWYKPAGKIGKKYEIFGQAVLGVKRDLNTAIDIDLSGLEDSTFISKTHASIIFNTNLGTWTIEDLGSTNGTYINGTKISTVSMLKKGDKVTIGKSEFIIK